MFDMMPGLSNYLSNRHQPIILQKIADRRRCAGRSMHHDATYFGDKLPPNPRRVTEEAFQTVLIKANAFAEGLVGIQHHWQKPFHTGDADTQVCDKSDMGFSRVCDHTSNELASSRLHMALQSLHTLCARSRPVQRVLGWRSADEPLRRACPEVARTTRLM